MDLGILSLRAFAAHLQYIIARDVIMRDEEKVLDRGGTSDIEREWTCVCFLRHPVV